MIKSNFIMKRFTLLLLILLTNFISKSQNIENGPMIGYSTMREVTVWIQTNKKAKVKIKYWPVSNPKNIQESHSLKTKKESEFTGHLIAADLEPGTQYNYIVEVNGKQKGKPNLFKTQELWQWRKDAPDFTFVAGSCFYINEEKYDRPGKGYGGDYSIINNIYKEKPSFMLWLGDNTYLREVDWDSRSGIYHRYNHTRSVPELKEMMANTPNYAIWDDHDYGPNDSDKSYYGKKWTLKAFKNFWANPVYGLGNTEGITGAFTWADTDFFLMDNRWYRTAQHRNGEILGKKQVDWLIESLQYSKASFKFIAIGGQFLNTAKVFENHSIYADERQTIIDAIDSLKIKNVVFLDGDRHHSEISKLTTKSGIVIHDITSSSLTSGTGNNRDEMNELRIPNSMQIMKNYATIQVLGSKKERRLIVTFKNSVGEKLFDYDILIK
jgi:alkaline phosphatase D